MLPLAQGFLGLLQFFGKFRSLALSATLIYVYFLAQGGLFVREEFFKLCQFVVEIALLLAFSDMAVVAFFFSLQLLIDVFHFLNAGF